MELATVKIQSTLIQSKQDLEPESSKGFKVQASRVEAEKQFPSGAAEQYLIIVDPSYDYPEDRLQTALKNAMATYRKAHHL